MSGVQGVQGPQGIQGLPGGTGPTGPQGNQGPQGPPFGPTGAGFYSSSTRLNISNFITGATITFTNATASTYYNIGSGTPLSALSNATSSPPMGAFWVFRNNTSSMITANLSNCTALYNNNAAASTVYIGSGNSLTLVYSGFSASFIAF
jgi:hypothetical protein